ncbi:MAG TPA: flagellar hook protein FlgE [Candidatus Baltobacteraceae bacterium]|jgi:flagellar hook protein FlgE
MAFDSLFTGISGLNAFQSQIDMISNNIANAGTTGFKGQRMTFADLFYQSQGYASGPTQQRGGVDPQELGLGVKVNSVDTNFQQGGLQTTGINTDLALNGDGFFVLRNTDGSGAPIYTRSGAFSLNSSGVLYDPGSGLAVQGYTANANGQITSTGTPGTVQIPLGLAQQATGTGSATAVKLGPGSDKNFDLSLGGSLDQTQYAAEATTTGSGQSKILTTTVYDSLGNAHQATITFKPIAPNTPPATALPPTVNDANGVAHNDVATRFQYTVSFADGTTMPAGANTGYAFFDSKGQYINSSAAAAGGAGHVAGTAAAPAQGDAITINGWGPTGPNNPNNSTVPTTIGFDFSNMSALAGTATANVIAQNGYAAGILSNITVGQDGTVTGSFTNGQQKALAQVAVATFQNEEGLHRAGGNGFVETANSGLAQYGSASTGRFGSIISGSLEQSNVSLADEFTKMIVAQRSFEANSRSISTADQNLTTAINIRASEN